MRFSEIMPHRKRIDHLVNLEKFGAYNAGYSGDGMTLAMPADGFSQGLVHAYMYDIGFACKDGPYGGYYFPLGSDNAPQHQRHFGNYPGGSPGFWFYCRFLPVE